MDRIAAGAAVIARARAAAVASWVNAGRRHDLTGWRASIGPLTRLALVTLLAYIALSILRALPWLMWLLTLAFLRAAWRAGKDQPQDTSEASEHPAAEADQAAVLALLRDVLGDQDRVHLSTVLAHLQHQGQGEGWTVADLRVRLEALSIPVRPKVKISGVPTRGLLRADLDALSPDQETAPSPHQVDAA
ncbi:hypothetical protein ACFWZY_01620 [Streptomyces sp. NPDC058992]|uniref:hypothetical protein n=1 Tax=Streptomyces sp. NPDC058992 TaxID=3346688 RepID=UPI00368F8188